MLPSFRNPVIKNISLCLFGLLFFIHRSYAQELFAYSEPASNMAAKSMGLRMNNYLMKDRASSTINAVVAPEIMFGVSKKLMVDLEFFTQATKDYYALNGGSAYVKYRFYSSDEVHAHFRMAAFARFTVNKSPLIQDAIDFNGYNSGYQCGMIATKLINKTAFSVQLSFDDAENKKRSVLFSEDKNKSQAISYTFSAGKLFLPKEYVSFKQLNVNGMLECMGQYNFNLKKSYLDAAPVLQFIINSKTRVDVGYRFHITKNLYSVMGNSLLLRFEYNLFNIFN